ncbi:MAG: response regulator [Anaerolineales bacterium]|nr:response regulator [Anaerolineales bacterium]
MKSERETVRQILFVDDDTDSLAMYVKAVSLANHKADIASSAMEGWDLIKKNSYDLIFVDLNIPGVSGLELLQKIRKDRKERKTPVIVLSAMPEESLVEDVLKAGARLFLEKPVALDELYSVIEKYKGKSSRSA